MFGLIKKDEKTKARAGILETARGKIETPVFMPVGTQATVKAIEQRELVESGAKIILGNTYHLYLRPGTDVIHKLGGLHRFMNWQDSILTDSGGYQVFSLKDLRKLSEDGVEFKSHIDGSSHFFSPEKVIEIQRYSGSDIVMVLDECTPYPSTREYTSKSMELSYRWAERSIVAFDKSAALYGKKQFLFAIVQGGMYDDLRAAYLNRAVQIEFDGYAIGGLSVGEPAEIMYYITDICTDIIPEKKPRYLMGVG
ncbi:MAG: Queuine tRNA-ribosyltransferase, partial [Bacteroidota bacterium]|nr:Queuine tRNA-ribosyltransferase [Bacteroidota bacterium]